MSRFNLRFAFWLLVGALLAACRRAPADRDLTAVTVQLQWLHQAQFAGFYAADQLGYYRDEGLAVTFLEGGAQVDNLKPVVEGRAQFGIAGPGQLFDARANGQLVRAIAAIYRRSPVVFIALADSGISRPQDFAGKTVRVVGNLIAPLHAMTTRVGVTPDQYSEINLPSQVDVFASGQADVWGCYLDGFVVDLQQDGYKLGDLNIIYPDDYSVHFLGDILFATDATIAKDPDLVLRFLRASLKGWTYVVENPEEVGDMVAVYNPGKDEAVENERMLVMLPLVNTGEDHIGWMEPEVWASMADTLRQQDELTKPLEIETMYTLHFLQEIYGR